MVKAFCVVCVLMTAATGQSASFDTASVRRDNGPWPPGTLTARGGPETNQPGRFTVTGVPLSLLILFAYDVDGDRLIAPGWITDLSTMYTVDVTMPAETTKEQFRLMLQDLLAKRFGLKVHSESRAIQGFELSIAEGGPKLSEWVPEPLPGGAAPTYPDVYMLQIPVLDSGHAGCTGGGKMGMITSFKITCRASMGDFARLLGHRYINNAYYRDPPGGLSPEVIDKTGLHGIYEFQFVFEGAVPGTAPTFAGNPPPPTGPTLFEALQRQLGLRLVNVGIAPASFLFVDSARKIPTDN